MFRNLLPFRPRQEVDRALSDAMASYWVNFAIHGDPNGAGLPPRPAYETARDTVLTFGDTIEVQSRVNGREVDFFDVYWEKVRKGELPDPGL